MKYNHAVKYKGEFYPTGAEVPVEEVTKETKEDGEVKADETVETVGEAVADPNAEATKETKVDEKPAKNK
jgi:rRNA maturation endonuclease Nob1